MKLTVFATACVIVASAFGEDLLPQPPAPVLTAVRDLRAAGDHDAAKRLVGTALRRTPDSPLFLALLALIEEDLGNYTVAERTNVRALGFCTGPEGAALRTTILANLAGFYLDRRKFEKLEEIRTELEPLAFSQVQQNPSGAALAFNVLGRMEHALNNDAEAERLYREAIRLCSTKGADVELAMVKNNIGSLHFSSGDFATAASLFHEAIDDLERVAGPDHPSLIRPLMNLAQTREREGHLDEAKTLEERALAQARHAFGPDHPFTAQVMLSEARVMRELGDKREARSLEKQARSALANNSESRWTDSTIDVHSLAARARR